MNEITQMIKVKSIPDRIRACRGSSVAIALILLKMEPNPVWMVSSVVMTNSDLAYV